MPLKHVKMAQDIGEGMLLSNTYAAECLSRVNRIHGNGRHRNSPNTQADEQYLLF